MMYNEAIPKQRRLFRYILYHIRHTALSTDLPISNNILIFNKVFYGTSIAIKKTTAIAQWNTCPDRQTRRHGYQPFVITFSYNNKEQGNGKGEDQE